MSASSIGAAKGGGYARYLEAKTTAPERGDYYLTPDGELTQSPGRWLADPETLARLGIDPDGPVAGGDFISLMEGRHPGGRDVGERARTRAISEVAEQLAGPPSPEQTAALTAITGDERLAVLIGPAGTGKGVVIDMATRAEKHAGHHTVGVAVSGSTAERLGETTPALEGRTSTIDALIARGEAGSVRLGPNTTVFLDEAGMADHRRLDALTQLIEQSGAKLVAVGDGKQLPSIGPGGMFDRLTVHARSAELADIHRTSDPGERQGWAALRRGEPETAMAHYQAEGQLFFMDDREQAGEAAVRRWVELTKTRPIHSVALIADSSNVEIDRLNARAQHLRAERGELGHQEVQLPHQHYGLREGDLITFTAQHHPRGQPRVENGARIPPHIPAHPITAPRPRQSSPTPRQTASPRHARTRAMSASASDSHRLGHGRATSSRREHR